MRTPLFGLLYSIIFCALSLLVAELITDLLVKFQFIEATNKELAHTLIMVTALIGYFHFAPYHSDDSDDSDDE